MMCMYVLKFDVATKGRCPVV